MEWGILPDYKANKTIIFFTVLRMLYKSPFPPAIF